MNISLKPSQTFYLDFDGVRQLLYFAEWPRYRFDSKERKEKEKTILTIGKCIWERVAIETPTRVLPQFQNWMFERTSKDVSIGCLNSAHNVIIEWMLSNAKIESMREEIGRIVNIKVISIYLSYSWAGKK